MAGVTRGLLPELLMIASPHTANQSTGLGYNVSRATAALSETAAAAIAAKLATATSAALARGDVARALQLNEAQRMLRWYAANPHGVGPIYPHALQRAVAAAAVVVVVAAALYFLLVARFV